MTTAGRILISIGVIAALLAGDQMDFLRPFLKETPLATIPYGVTTLINALGLALLAAVIVLVGGREARPLVRLAGLSAPIRQPLLFAAAIFIPATAIAMLIAKPAADISLYDQAFLSVIFPAMEEIGFRGLAIGALMGLARWPFALAALLPAAIFGVAHLGQGDNPAEIAGIVAITGAGGLLFGWMFVRWGFNLWPAIVAHAGMNALWGVFDLGENAIGGWTGNALRLGVVAAAIGLTLLMAPKKT
ncbi:MAG: CPBP family intramembrane glutamic endopeptidase [Parvularculaceae bacterium]|nr:CPBP family intramembrane glutamic endopeptidase [Parvularculaceae bacterium]